MKYTFLCYEKCSTCKKAEVFLKEQGVEYTIRPIKEQHPTAEELKRWNQASGLPLKRFFNTSGMIYRSMELSQNLPQMSEEDQFALLATDGMLVKRPMLIAEDESQVLVGFKQKEWEEGLGVSQP